MKLLNSFWFVDVGRLLYNGPTISHFFINSRIKRWIDWKKWKRLMGGPPSTGSAALLRRQQWIQQTFHSKERKVGWFMLRRKKKKSKRSTKGPTAPRQAHSATIQFHSPALRDWNWLNCWNGGVWAARPALKTINSQRELWGGALVHSTSSFQPASPINSQIN